MALRKVILDVDGADCPSCAFAIEQTGRRIKGVQEIRVVTAKREIHVLYEGEAAVLQQIIDIVRKLGYTATVRQGEPAY